MEQIGTVPSSEEVSAEVTIVEGSVLPDVLAAVFAEVVPVELEEPCEDLRFATCSQAQTHWWSRCCQSESPLERRVPNRHDLVVTAANQDLHMHSGNPGDSERQQVACRGPWCHILYVR